MKTLEAGAHPHDRAASSERRLRLIGVLGIALAAGHVGFLVRRDLRPLSAFSTLGVVVVAAVTLVIAFRPPTRRKFAMLVPILAAALVVPLSRPIMDISERLRPTASALSPHGEYGISLIERPSLLDRNFTVELANITTGERRVIFESPDEGRPIGTERFVWSADGSRFLLLGRHFFVTDGILGNGEQAYLMVDVPTGRVWCNASQQHDYPNFGLRELQTIEWMGLVPD